MIRIIIENLEVPNPSDFTNTDFKPYVVGNSNPLGDKINPSLLKDVDTAAKNAGVKVSITTAVSGHRPGSRHEQGLAVDIAIINGKGYGSEKDAESKGIKDDIQRFVSELQKMGYVKNSESGNDKAVLTFGFPNHQHHVHVSRKSDTGGTTPDNSQPEKDNSNTEVKTDDAKYDNIEFGDEEGEENDNSYSFSDDEYQGMLSNLVGGLVHKENYERIFEDIKRIKTLL